MDQKVQNTNFNEGYFNYFLKICLTSIPIQTYLLYRMIFKTDALFLNILKKVITKQKFSCEMIFFFELTLLVCICLNLIEQLSTSIWQPAHADNFHFCCINRNHHSERRGYQGRAEEW